MLLLFLFHCKFFFWSVCVSFDIRLFDHPYKNWCHSSKVSIRIIIMIIIIIIIITIINKSLMITTIVIIILNDYIILNLLRAKLSLVSVCIYPCIKQRILCIICISIFGVFSAEKSVHYTRVNTVLWFTVQVLTMTSCHNTVSFHLVCFLIQSAKLWYSDLFRARNCDWHSRKNEKRFLFCH